MSELSSDLRKLTGFISDIYSGNLTYSAENTLFIQDPSTVLINVS